jgi:hypothetical protein
MLDVDPAAATEGDAEPASEDDCAETGRVNKVIASEPIKTYCKFRYLNDLLL